MGKITVIAGKELTDGLRNRWIVAITLLLAVLSLSIAFLGAAPVGGADAGRLAVTVVSLASLTVFLAPLIALMLSYDAIVGEMERGTMLLMLSYPISRWQLMLGKFLGHLAIIAIAMVLGYGAAVGAILASGEVVTAHELAAFGGLVGTSILLGGAFIALGYLISSSVSERATAAGMAVGVWLLFALLYDMALLGVIVADGGEGLSGAVFNLLLLLNPADAFRLFNLTGFDAVANVTGMSAAVAKAALPSAVPLVVLVAWMALPLGLAMLRFKGREL